MSKPRIPIAKGLKRHMDKEIERYYKWVIKPRVMVMKFSNDWEKYLTNFVDMVNKTNDKQRKWIDGKLEVVCPACKNIAEHKEFTTFDYWYCNTCKAEV